MLNLAKLIFLDTLYISRNCEIMITMFEVGMDKEVVCGHYLDNHDLCHHVRGRGGRGNGL